MSAADTLLEYIERREQVAAQRERAAIVAWLRSEACFYWLLRNTGGFTRDQAPNLADAINAGEHLRADDE